MIPGVRTEISVMKWVGMYGPVCVCVGGGGGGGGVRLLPPWKYTICGFKFEKWRAPIAPLLYTQLISGVFEHSMLRTCIWVCTPHVYM